MAGAITSLPPHYQIAFDTYWRENIAQQRDQRLAGTFEEVMIDGEAQRFDIMGAQTYAMRQVTARAQKTEPSDVPTAFYWVRPRPYDKTTWIDQFDHINLGKLGDPSSAIMRNHAIAAMRQKDILALAALGGTRYIGAQGTQAQVLPVTGGPFGTGQVIGVTYGSGGANSGLQLSKLTATSYIMDWYDVAQEGRIFALSAREMNNLITNVDQVNNVLYNDVRALRAGRVRDFMSFEFRMTQLIPFVSGSSTIRSCFAWQREFLVCGKGQDVMSTLDRLPTQSNAWQIYTCLLMDFTRRQDEGVVQVNCDNSV